LEVFAQLKGNRDLGIEMLAETAAGSSVRKYTAKIYLGVKYLLFPELDFPRTDVQQNDFKKSAILFDEGLKDLPNSPQFIILWAIVQRRLGNIKESQDRLASLQEILMSENVYSYTTRVHIALGHMFSFEFEEGVKVYQAVLEDPNCNTRCINGVFGAICKSMLGQRDEAYAMVDAAVEAGKADEDNKDLRLIASRYQSREANLLPFGLYEFLTIFKVSIKPDKQEQALQKLDELANEFGLLAPPAEKQSGWFGSFFQSTDSSRDRQMLSYRTARGWLLLHLGREKEAIAEYLHVKDLNTKSFNNTELISFWTGYWECANWLFNQGDVQQAKALLHKIKDGNGATPQLRSGATKALEKL